MDGIKAVVDRCVHRVGREVVERPEVAIKALFTSAVLLEAASYCAAYRLGLENPFPVGEIQLLILPDLSCSFLYAIDSLVPWPSGPSYSRKKLAKRAAYFCALQAGVIWVVSRAAKRVLDISEFKFPFFVNWITGGLALYFCATGAVLGGCGYTYLKRQGQPEASPEASIDDALEFTILGYLGQLERAVRASLEIAQARTVIAELDEDRLREGAPCLDLPEVAFALQEWEPLFNAVEESNQRYQQLASALSTLSPNDQNDLAQFHHRDSQLLIDRFQQLGYQLSKMADVQRRADYLDWLRDLLSHCATTWAQESDLMLRDIVSEGKGLEWLVRQRHQDLKWEIVVAHIQSKLDLQVDGQHWKAAWSRLFGRELGMEDPSGIDGEMIYLLQSRHWTLNLAMSLWETALRMTAKDVIAAFRTHYSPDLLVKHWQSVTRDKENHKNRRLSDVIGTFLLEKYPTGTFPLYVDEDPAQGLTDEGAILFLQLMGEFQQSKETPGC